MNEIKEKAFWFVAAIIYMAVLYVLVRPHSQGPAIVASLFGAFTDLVRGAGGQTYSNGKWEAPN